MNAGPEMNATPDANSGQDMNATPDMKAGDLT